MPEKQSETPKKVAPRNNLSSAVLRKHSRSNELQGRNPDFVYEYFYDGENLAHPGHVNRKLQPHEHGTDRGGYVDIPAWEPCNRIADPGVAQAERREDQGKSLGGAIRRGRQVLCRIHKDHHALYALADEADAKVMERQYHDPDKMRRPGSAMTAVISTEEGADTNDMLTQAGHPFPGQGGPR